MGEVLFIAFLAIAGFLWVRRHWPRKARPARPQPWLVADGEFGGNNTNPQEDW